MLTGCAAGTVCCLFATSAAKLSTSLERQVWTGCLVERAGNLVTVFLLRTVTILFGTGGTSLHWRTSQTPSSRRGSDRKSPHFPSSASMGTKMRLCYFLRYLHVCQCNYLTTTGQNLNYHIKTHTGEKPHQCNHCGYSSILESTVKQHKSTHTAQCAVCTVR